jgi:hypothetical protein
MPRGPAKIGTIIDRIGRAIAAADDGDLEADKPSPRDPPSDPERPTHAGRTSHPRMSCSWQLVDSSVVTLGEFL